MEIELSNDSARVSILSHAGGAMRSYEVRTSAGWRPLLTGQAGVVNFPLVPWQNRISNGGFGFAGRFVPLSQNVEGSPFPIHGNGWQLPWTIASRDEGSLLLVLQSDGPSDYRYAATLRYALGGDGSLECALSVTNRGAELPFGLGFHPFFTRTPDVELQARAATVTLQDELYMPTETVPVESRPEWDFSRGRPLPSGWINNEFGGWDGVAEVSWPSWNLGCTVVAPGTSRYLIYSPQASAPFFCFEPVSHSIDAFNRGSAPENGLVVLKAGETIELRSTFRPHPL